MIEALRTALLAGPLTVKEIAAQIGKSESRTRELLKADQTTIHSKKEDGRGNVFWLPADRAEGTPATTIDATNDLTDLPTEGVVEGPVQTVDELDPPVEPTAREVGVKQALADGMCPFCHATEGQTQAGPEGTFLGAALTCGTCAKTYNKFTGDEIKVPAKTEKAKRQPLNPQYKINAKQDAVKEAGGKLVFEREAREWVLTGKGVVVRMTAKEFSVETPETLVTKLNK